MSLAAYVIIVYVAVPLVLGAVAGAPKGYWAWAAIAIFLVALQATSEAILFFKLLVLVLAVVGTVPVAIGASLRGRLLRRHR